MPMFNNINWKNNVKTSKITSTSAVAKTFAYSIEIVPKKFLFQNLKKIQKNSLLSLPPPHSLIKGLDRSQRLVN